MGGWFPSALLALVLFGFWGFFPKLAVQYIPPRSAVLFQVAGSLAVALCVLPFVGFRPETHPKGALFAALTGIAGVLGTLFYYQAAGRGRISLVVSLTALYPLITILLAAVFLREPLAPRQLLGMAFALVAIFLLAD